MNDEWLLEEGTLNPGGLMTTTLVFMHGRGQEFKNPAELPHSIERYLNHPEVAGPIGTAVQAVLPAP